MFCLHFIMCRWCAIMCSCQKFYEQEEWLSKAGERDDDHCCTCWRFWKLQLWSKHTVIHELFQGEKLV
jgi:hypothetical protein